MRRSRKQLELAVEAAESSQEKAIACYNLGLFHDNNSRESEAIPWYEQALALGLTGEMKAQALAWLASSLYKTGNPQMAMEKAQESFSATSDSSLKRFLSGLEKRIHRKLPEG
ncbi:MAG: tetratricopeptide repeat protein [Chloroflexi bacterium]|nr:tetratricopeptide repeat protein [Chloroflexota bacterium]